MRSKPWPAMTSAIHGVSAGSSAVHALPNPGARGAGRFMLRAVVLWVLREEWILTWTFVGGQNIEEVEEKAQNAGQTSGSIFL